MVMVMKTALESLAHLERFGKRRRCFHFSAELGAQRTVQVSVGILAGEVAGTVAGGEGWMADECGRVSGCAQELTKRKRNWREWEPLPLLELELDTDTRYIGWPSTISKDDTVAVGAPGSPGRVRWLPELVAMVAVKSSARYLTAWGVWCYSTITPRRS